MNITLCEQCFPYSGDYEVLSIVPLGPCLQCGKRDDIQNPDTRCYVFRRDPRPDHNHAHPMTTTDHYTDIADLYSFLNNEIGRWDSFSNIIEIQDHIANLQRYSDAVRMILEHKITLKY